MLSTRRGRHDLVSAWLAARDDDELAELLHAAPDGAVGVGGGSSVLDIDGIAVFTKRIPITDRELAHPRSTANLFGLPASCQYGMHRLASPGFGAWRELAANITVTQGVLGGESASFALLHHWRVLPGWPPIASEHRDIDAVVAQFGGNLAVRTRLEELARAGSSLVLFLEHLPDQLADRLNDPLNSAETLERQLFEALAFLRRREVLHMDGHFANMRADADQRWSCGTQRLCAPVRERRHPAGCAGGSGEHHRQARSRCGRDERLLLAPGRWRHLRTVSRAQSRTVIEAGQQETAGSARRPRLTVTQLAGAASLLQTL